MDSIEEIFSDKTKLRQLIRTSAKPSLSMLKKSFLQSVEGNTHNIEKAAILFSGGIDSSLVAKAVAEKVPNTVLFSVGLKGSNALDFPAHAAELLKLPLNKVAVSAKELPIVLDKASKIIHSENFLQLQITVPEFFAMKAAKERGFRHVFSGQGADELFFGYDEFRRALAKGAAFSKLEQMRKEKLLNLWQDNLSRDLSIARHFGLELKVPFLNAEFIKQAIAFSAKENILSAEDFLRKRVLRKLAKQLSLPREITQRRKKAIQYDSGLSKELESLCRA